MSKIEVITPFYFSKRFSDTILTWHVGERMLSNWGSYLYSKGIPLSFTIHVLHPGRHLTLFQFWGFCTNCQWAKFKMDEFSFFFFPPCFSSPEPKVQMSFSDQTWHKAFLGWRWFMLVQMKGPRADNYEIAKIHWWTIFISRTTWPISTKLVTNIFKWRGFILI